MMQRSLLIIGGSGFIGRNLVEKSLKVGLHTTVISLTKITDNKSLPGTEQPFYYWIPSIGPSGMTFLTSKIYNGWENSLFVGSLKFEYLERIVIEDNKVVKREKILNKIGRIRDVTQGPDGFLYVSVEGKGVVKIIPKI